MIGNGILSLKFIDKNWNVNLNQEMCSDNFEVPYKPNLK